MNLKRVLEIYEIIKERLPSTYPKPKLAFYEDEESLADNHFDGEREPEGQNLLGACDIYTNTIVIPLSLLVVEEKSNGEKVVKKKMWHKKSNKDIAEILLHELCHAYYAKRYGKQSKQCHDEAACDRFAFRWSKKLIQEKLLEE